jgi:hypothetical protein
VRLKADATIPNGLYLFVLLFKPPTQFIQDGCENERHLTTQVERRHLDGNNRNCAVEQANYI